MSPSKLLFLIPARGGSKGLPGKNLACVGGIPLVGRASRLARRAAKVFGPSCKVVCSTDDREIAGAAEAWGAEIPFLRPSELASDHARTTDVILHALETLKDVFDSVVLLQPTSPLTALEDVVGTVELHLKSAAPVVSVCAAEHPPEWLFTRERAGRIERLLRNEITIHQRQGSIAAYRLNGAVYASDVATFREHRTFITAKTRGFVMPGSRSIDVDTFDDLELARNFIKKQSRSVRIGGQPIGGGKGWFVIADAVAEEKSDRAQRLIDAAADAGADAIHLAASGDSCSALARQCRQRGIVLISSSCEAADALRVSMQDIASDDVLASGMAKGSAVFLAIDDEPLPAVAAAVDALEESGCDSIVLLPRTLQTRQRVETAFGWPAGFSDFNAGNEMALAAAAVGAEVIEKSFFLDRSPGPAELSMLVRGLREVHAALDRGEH